MLKAVKGRPRGNTRNVGEHIAKELESLHSVELLQKLRETEKCVVIDALKVEVDRDRRRSGDGGRPAQRRPRPELQTADLRNSEIFTAAEVLDEVADGKDGHCCRSFES